MNLLENEIYSMTLTPWTTANPRNDHQLIFPLSDGRLLFGWCQYYLRRPSKVFSHPYSPDGAQDDAPCRISAKVSKDRGRTWSEKITLQDNTGADNVKHPNLLRLSSGRILFSYTQRDMKNNDLRVYLKCSDDECETWSSPVKISPEDGIYYTCADHILRHSSGRIILPTHAGKLSPDTGAMQHWQALCLSSDDDGTSWKQSRQGAKLPDKGTEEPAVVELKDGSLLAMLRTSLLKLYRTVSTDRGETWAPPTATDLDSPAAAKCIKRIPSTGDLLLIWNNVVPYGGDVPIIRGGPHYPRNPLGCAISRDEGETWESFKNIENREGYDSAYPSVTFLDDEAPVTYYSNVRSGIVGIVSEVKLKIFPIDWFYSDPAG